MFANILVPTDGSECARAAIDYAGDIATRFGSTVHTLCVVDSRTLENAPHYDELKEECDDIARRTAEDLSGNDHPIETAVETGLPHESILNYANDEEIDLIVMGTHGRTGVERYVLGSVTEKVLRLADQPVLTVGEVADDEGTFPYTDILIPTDGSDGATPAVELGVNLASRYDARVHALSVVETVGMGTDISLDTVLDALEKEARTAVEHVQNRAAEESVETVETALEHGIPHQAIHSYVDDHDIDLVVMGTHGRSGIERYLLGSVTEKTVRTSDVPVMTVRRPD